MARNKSVRASTADFGISVLAVSLSLASAGFALYFILLAPAVNSGISQTAESRYLASASQADSDPIITGTTTKLVTAENARKWAPEIQRLTRYKIRVLDNRQAFMDTFHGKTVASTALKIGDLVPGVGKILAIDNFNGNWYLQTDRGTLASEGILFD